MATTKFFQKGMKDKTHIDVVASPSASLSGHGLFHTAISQTNRGDTFMDYVTSKFLTPIIDSVHEKIIELQQGENNNLFGKKA